MSPATSSIAPWPTKRLKYCATYNDEVLPESTDDFTLIRYVEISDVSLTTGIENSTDMFFHEAPSRARRKIQRGDVLVSTVRTYLKAIASVNEAPDNLIASTGFCVVRPIPTFDHHYLGWAVKSERFVGEIVSRSVGVSYPAMNASQLVDIHVPVPPFETQKRIAAFLDEKTAHIDALIKKKRTLLERLAEKRQAIISQTVTKGLDPFAPMNNRGIDWLMQIPAHWEVRGLTKCTTRIDYRGATPEKSSSGIFLVTARNVKNGRIDYKLSEEYISEDDYDFVMRRGKPRIGDVLLTTEAPLGQIASIDRIDIALAQRIIKFSTSIPELDNAYLGLWMQTSAFQFDLQSRATGSTALGIKASKIVELRCLLPRLAEQQQIVAFVNAAIDAIDLVIDKIADSVCNLSEYRSATITSAVTGKPGEIR